MRLLCIPGNNYNHIIRNWYLIDFSGDVIEQIEASSSTEGLVTS
jgi:hypothetical protein